MSEKPNAKEGKTVCNSGVMLAIFTELSKIQTTLLEIREKAAALSAEFSESYEGEAKEEVVAFLENLPIHIYKLALFYGKMAQYVFVTKMSFDVNDQDMADKLGG